MDVTQSQMAQLIELFSQIRWMLALILLFSTSGMGLIVWMAVTFFKSTRAAIAAGIGSGASSSGNLPDAKYEDLLARGRYDEAIEVIGKKLSEFPDHLYAHFYMAQAYTRKRDWRKARHHAEELKRIYPAWSEVADRLVKQFPPESSEPALNH